MTTTSEDFEDITGNISMFAGVIGELIDPKLGEAYATILTGKIS